MSGNKKAGSVNTLMSYFSRTPKASAKKKSIAPKTPSTASSKEPTVTPQAKCSSSENFHTPDSGDSQSGGVKRSLSKLAAKTDAAAKSLDQAAERKKKKQKVEKKQESTNPSKKMKKSGHQSVSAAASAFFGGESKKPSFTTTEKSEDEEEKSPMQLSKAQKKAKTKTKQKQKQKQNKGKKRKKNVIADSDSESEYEPESEEDDDDEFNSDDCVSEEEDDDDYEDEDYEESPQKKKPKRRGNNNNKRSRKRVRIDDDEENDDDDNDNTGSSFKGFSAYAASSSSSSSSSSPSSTMDTSDDSVPVSSRQQMDEFALGSGVQHQGNLKVRNMMAKQGSGRMRDYQVGNSEQHDPAAVKWRHLQPDTIKDIKGRRPDHPEYDSRTVYIPQAAWKKYSPGETQYWKIKQHHWDVVLFFKVGKFYELFDVDAEIGVRELGLSFMKSVRPHAGFPESAYDKYANQLIRLGYMVGRVEQTETPQQLEEANKQRRAQGLTKRKVVDRKMCSVLTKGTLVDEQFISSGEANYMLVVTEQCDEKDFEGTLSSGMAMKTDYGVCFVDTSTGRFYLGQFEDDRQRTRLRTLVAQIRPEEVVFPKEGLSRMTQNILRAELRGSTLRHPILPGKEMWDAKKTCAEIEEAGYFKDNTSSTDTGPKDENGWPVILSNLRTDSPLAMSALGGCIWFLRRLILDMDLISMANFTIYDPSQSNQSQFLVLDGQTLTNLEILENSEGGTTGTLLNHVNHTVTPFGQRLMKDWLAHPLAKIRDINARLDAVEVFMKNGDLLDDLWTILKKLPDLERLVARIHANSISKPFTPIMYYNVSAKQVEMLIKALRGFRQALQIPGLFDNIDRTSRLEELTTIGEAFPDMMTELDFFENAFDATEAKRTGFINPKEGINEEYDDACQKVEDMETRLKSFLSRMKVYFGDSTIKYYHRGKETYQLEIKVDTLKKKGVPDEFQLMSQSKRVKRFWTQDIRRIVPDLEQAIFDKDAILKDNTRLMFARFCQHYQTWIAAVNTLAELDCIASLARTSAYQEGNSCRPDFVELKDNDDKPMLDLRQAIHPSIVTTSKTFIPNDTVLGCAENPSRFVLVSGPNMGGKSTLLRQTCCALILAHLGCYVPAESCRLTPVDRIFTRVGANDRIMQGQSTFLVELEETANILRHATNRSLVILDELGRGTSTFDGTAIAYSVIKYLSQKTKCLSLFSTHYHMLMEEYANDPLISMYHMGCQVHPNKEDVTFLYTFISGTCPKSYGMNVAKLAGLPQQVVKRAKEMSESFECRLEQAHKQGRVEGKGESNNNSSNSISNDDNNNNSNHNNNNDHNGEVTVTKEMIGAIELALRQNNLQKLRTLQNKLQELIQQQQQQQTVSAPGFSSAMDVSK